MSKKILIAMGTTLVIILLVLLLTSTSSNDSSTDTLSQTDSDTSSHHGSAAADEKIFNDLVGKKAPNLELESYDGKKISLEQFKGKNVVLFFSEGLMCYPSCWNQIAAFGKDSAFNNKDTVVLTITVDRKIDWGQAVSKMPELVSATVLFDENKVVSNEYGVLTLSSSMHRGQFPGHTYFIVDKEGIIRFVKDDPEMGVRNDELKSELEKIK